MALTVQALAKAAGHETSAVAAELSALAVEAEMPLEQLMAQCGYVVPDSAPEVSADGTKHDTAECAEKEAEVKLEGSGGNAAAAGESTLNSAVPL